VFNVIFDQLNVSLLN